MLLLCTVKAFAKMPEIYEWQMSDSADFCEYEPCGYGKELVLTRELYGKYIRFVYTDQDGNVSIGDVKGPVRYKGRNVIDFSKANWVIEAEGNGEHFVKCVDGRLTAANISAELVSDNALITLPEVMTNTKQTLCFKTGATMNHQRMKLFFLDENKNTVFTIYLSRREDKILLLDTSSSQFSAALKRTDAGKEMRIMLSLDGENGIISIQNEDSDGLSPVIERAVAGNNIAHIKVSNEYMACDAWIDDVCVTGNDIEADVKRAGIWGQTEGDRSITAQVYSYTPTPANVKVIAAFYIGDYLSDVKVYNKTISDDITETGFTSDVEYDSVRLFVWDSEEDGVPLGKSCECD